MSTETETSCVAQIRARIDAACVGSWSAPAVAVVVVDDLRRNDPKLLQEFLNLHAVALVRDLINRRDSSARSYNRLNAPRSAFHRAVEQHEQGDSAPLEEYTHFLNELYVIETGAKMALKDMRQGDLTFVANNFRTLAKQNELRAMFLEVLARKCGDKTVGEIYTEEQVADMWLSVTG